MNLKEQLEKSRNATPSEYDVKFWRAEFRRLNEIAKPLGDGMRTVEKLASVDNYFQFAEGLQKYQNARNYRANIVDTRRICIAFEKFISQQQKQAA